LKLIAIGCSGGSVILKRVAGDETGLGRRATHAPAAAIAASTAPTPNGTSQAHHAGLASASLAIAESAAGAVNASSMSKRTAVAESSRRFESLVKQRRSILEIDRGVGAVSAFQSGSLFNTLASTSETSSPSNARVPVSISNSTHPNAHMSLRRSAGLPRACSGLMYAAVPSIIPAPVSITGLVIVGECMVGLRAFPLSCASFASPKSSTLTAPSDRSLMLAGLRSR
jgi:hypothetical protein